MFLAQLKSHFLSEKRGKKDKTKSFMFTLWKCLEWKKNCSKWKFILTEVGFSGRVLLITEEEVASCPQHWQHFRIGTLSWVLNVTTAASKMWAVWKIPGRIILDRVICWFLMFCAYFLSTLQNLLSGGFFKISIDIDNVRKPESRYPWEQSTGNNDVFVYFDRNLASKLH